MSIGCGMLKLPASVVEEMTLREFSAAYFGYMMERESMQKDLYETMRLQTTAVANMLSGKGRTLRPHQLFRFPWDGEVEKQRANNLKKRLSWMKGDKRFPKSIPDIMQ